MNKFTPADNYDALLIQARALHRYAEAGDRIKLYYMKKDHTLSEQRLKALEESLESERQMNCILTEELEAKRPKVEYKEIQKALEMYQMLLDHYRLDVGMDHGEQHADALLRAKLELIKLKPFNAREHIRNRSRPKVSSGTPGEPVPEQDADRSRTDDGRRFTVVGEGTTSTYDGKGNPVESNAQ